MKPIFDEFYNPSGKGAAPGRRAGPRPDRAGRMKMTTVALCLLNALVVLAVIGVLAAGEPASARSADPGDSAGAAERAGGDPSGAEGMKAVAAAVAIGLGALGAGISVAVVGSAAVGGISRNPEIFGRSLVFVGLAEGIAIYGLIIAFMILTL